MLTDAIHLLLSKALNRYALFHHPSDDFALCVRAQQALDDLRASTAPGAPCGYTVERVRGGVRLMDDTLNLDDARGLALAILRSAAERAP